MGYVEATRDWLLVTNIVKHGLSFTFCTHLLIVLLFGVYTMPCIPGVLGQGDAEKEDLEPIKAILGGSQEEASKLGFPEVQGDMAPSALVPKATACIMKHVVKVNTLVAEFQKAETLTPLQLRTLHVVLLDTDFSLVKFDVSFNLLTFESYC